MALPTDDDLGAALGLGKKSPAPGAMPEEDPLAADNDADGEVAAQELLDAQAANDAPGVWAAIKAMVALAGG